MLDLQAVPWLPCCWSLEHSSHLISGWWLSGSPMYCSHPLVVHAVMHTVRDPGSKWGDATSIGVLSLTKVASSSFSWKKACKSCLLTLPSCSKKTWPFPALLRKKAVLLSYKTLRCYLAYYNLITFCIVGKLTSAASWTFEFKPLLLVQARDCLSMQFSTPQNRSLEGPSIGQRRNINIVPWGASEAGPFQSLPNLWDQLKWWGGLR